MNTLHIIMENENENERRDLLISIIRFNNRKERKLDHVFPVIKRNPCISFRQVIVHDP